MRLLLKEAELPLEVLVWREGDDAAATDAEDLERRFPWMVAAQSTDKGAAEYRVVAACHGLAECRVFKADAGKARLFQCVLGALQNEC